MIKPDNQEEYLTTTQVADILNLSEFTVRLLARNGKFKNAKRPGKSWLIPKLSVTTYIESGDT